MKEKKYITNECSRSVKNEAYLTFIHGAYRKVFKELQWFGSSCKCTRLLFLISNRVDPKCFIHSFLFQIAEKYAFLPREAVTRFLMSCSDCQKRMHLSSADSTNNESVNSSFVIPQSQYSFRTTEHDNEAQSVPIVDFNMPITQTYLNHLKYRNLHTEVYSDEVRVYFLFSLSDIVILALKKIQ